MQDMLWVSINAKSNKPEPMTCKDLPTGPWKQISADFLRPLPSKDSLIVITHYYSRWVEVVIMKFTTVEKTVEAMHRIFCKHKCPNSITTDNGPKFISQTFRDYMKEHGIHHHKVTSLWPEVNGEVEPQNCSILKHLRIAQAEQKCLERGTVDIFNDVEKLSAFSNMLFHRKLHTKLPELSDHHP